MLAQATPDKLTAVERFLKGGPLPGGLAPANEAGVVTPVETPDPLGYTLRREPACWVLVFQGQRAYLIRQERGHTAPDPVAREFAGYIGQHILVPSRRYTVARKGANVRVARGELAGHLFFERPPGHGWAVRV